MHDNILIHLLEKKQKKTKQNKTINKKNQKLIIIFSQVVLFGLVTIFRNKLQTDFRKIELICSSSMCVS